MTRDEFVSRLEKPMALLFLVAGALKAADPAKLARSIDNYQMLPAALAALMALYLPWLEMLAGLALLIGKLRRGSLLTMSCLCGLFMLAAATATVRGLDINCGCFSSWANLPVLWALFRNIFLFVICLMLLNMANRRAAAFSKRRR